MSAAAWQIFFGLPLACGAAVLGAEDLRTGYLSDQWIFLLGCLGLTMPLVSGILLGNPEGVAGLLPLWMDSLAGALAGGGILLFLRVVSGGGLGGGDVNLGVALGIWLGPAGMLLTLAAAFIAGGLLAGVILLFRRGVRAIPFGPFLGIGGWLVYLYGAPFLSWYGALL